MTTAPWRAAPTWKSSRRQHDLKIGTIADLIRYRLDKERSVERIAEQRCRPSSARSGCSATRITSIAPCTWRWCAGELDAKKSRRWCACICKNTLGDVVGIHEPALGWPLRSAMQRIAKEGHGVIVILRPEETRVI